MPCQTCRRIRAYVVGQHQPKVKPSGKVYDRKRDGGFGDELALSMNDPADEILPLETPGKRLICAAKEAAEIARGEREPARITSGDAP